MSDGIAALLTPSPAASVFKTFGKLTKILFFICWMVCLPFELILHRRIGKRYQNTFFFFVAMFVLTILVGVLFLPGLPLGSTAHDVETRNRILLQASHSLVPFNLVFWGATIAFLAHYWCNRTRFGTPSQLHSFDFGIPWLIYPPLALWRMVAGQRRIAVDAAGAAAGGSPGHISSSRLSHFGPGGGHAEVVAYPTAGFLRNARHYLAHHVAKLDKGECPYGPFTWLALAILEPALLMISGLTIAFLSTFSGFGVYLALGGLALFVKGQIHQAEWREWVYDEADQQHEIEAKRNWRQGKPATALSSAFIVPITLAVIPPYRPTGWSEPVTAGPGFEHLMPNSGKNVGGAAA